MWWAAWESVVIVVEGPRRRVLAGTKGQGGGKGKPGGHREGCVRRVLWSKHDRASRGAEAEAARPAHFDRFQGRVWILSWLGPALSILDGWVDWRLLACDEGLVG